MPGPVVVEQKARLAIASNRDTPLALVGRFQVGMFVFGRRSARGEFIDAIVIHQQRARSAHAEAFAAAQPCSAYDTGGDAVQNAHVRQLRWRKCEA